MWTRSVKISSTFRLKEIKTSAINNSVTTYVVALMLVFVPVHGLSKDRFSAATLDYPPYEYLEGGSAKGIAIELISQAIKRSGAQAVNFNFYPWRRAVNAVALGHDDMLFNAGKNKARQAWGYYVNSPLIIQKYVLFKRKGDDIKINASFDNADHLPIAIRTGYLYGTGMFREALNDGRFSYIVESETTMQSIDLLLNKRVDVFVGDYVPVMHYIKEQGLENYIDIVKDQTSLEDLTVLDWPTYIVFSKKSVDFAFVEKMSNALDEMKLDGTYAHIFDKYIQ